MLNTIAACGDVNRNVMSNPNPYQSKAHAVALELARGISDHLTPRTGAYREIWLDGEKIVGGEPEEVEPIYGRTYLPRKFKTVVAVPPSNDVDVFAHDLGFIAILDAAGDVTGWNVTVGGGMGMTHGEPDTYPRAADVMGFCQTRDAIAVAEAVVTVQRDWGDRSNRKHARLKYTIEDRGLDAFRAEVEKRAGVKLGAAQPFAFTSTGDRYGWIEGENGKAHLTLYVPNGRIQDVAGGAGMLTGLRKIAEIHKGDMRLTREPERHHRQCLAGDARDDRGDRHAVPAGAADLRLAPQFDGLRGAADLRPRARRERALPARPDRRARPAAGRLRPLRRRHRDPHDRLPERLRAALSRRDRPGRQRTRPLQSLSRRGVRQHRAFPSSTPRTCSTTPSWRRSIRCSPPTRRSASRTSTSANS